VDAVDAVDLDPIRAALAETLKASDNILEQ
jgi:hypothetical protein